MPSLTNYGQQVALHDDDRGILGGLNGSASGAGGLANLISEIELYDSGSTPGKDASTAVFDTPSGGGYSPIAISKANWTPSLGGGGDVEMVLANQTFTASGGSIDNVDGAFVTDNASPGNVLAWWERSSTITLALSDSITADQLTVRIV